MSGYRTLHRIEHSSETKENSKVSNRPFWRVRLSPCRLSTSPQSTSQRIIAAGAADNIQCYSISDRTGTSVDSNDVLNASTLTVESADRLEGTIPTPRGSKLALGYSALDVARNYCGADASSGNEIIAASQLGGRICIWIRLDPNLIEKGLKEEKAAPGVGTKPQLSFTVAASTGTTLAIRPPQLANYYSKKENDVIVAVGCANGSVILCKSGIQAYRPGESCQSTNKVVGDSFSCSEETINILSGSEPGEVVATIGGGHAAVLSLVFHPTIPNALALGRQDGTIDIYSLSSSSTDMYYCSGEMTFRRMHRMTHSSFPVRALSFSQPDGALLFAGDDNGKLYSYDVSCNNIDTTGDMSGPVKLVACALTAHKGWIMDLCAFPDGSRVATCGSDKSVRVWDGIGIASSSPVHSFEGVHDGLVWGVAVSRTIDSLKLISCGNDGVIQVCSCGE